MKKSKRIVSVLLAMVLFVSAFAAVPVSAASTGTMVSNAVQASFGVTYYKGWTKSTDHLNHYVTFTLAEQGIVTINATKPFDSKGESPISTAQQMVTDTAVLLLPDNRAVQPLE